MNLARLISDRNGCLATDTDADRIDLYAQGAGCLGRGQWRDLPAIVDTIRQQNDYFGFRGRRAQVVDPCSKRRADRRAVFSADADVDTLEILQKPAVIQGQRADDVRRARKSYETDAVV